MIKAAHHVALAVSDMERSLAFYRDLLGMEVTLDGRLAGPGLDRVLGLEGVDTRRVWLAAFGITLELFEFASPRGKPFPPDFRVCDGGYTHLGFQVENIQGLYENLAAKGVSFISPPTQIREGAVGCYLRDPDGMVLSFVELG